jgi:hypothetical protein
MPRTNQRPLSPRHNQAMHNDGGEWQLVAHGSVNVRFGSLADIDVSLTDVRFTPDSGHSSVQVECPKSANSSGSRHPAEPAL